MSQEVAEWHCCQLTAASAATTTTNKKDWCKLCKPLTNNIQMQLETRTCSYRSHCEPSKPATIYNSRNCSCLILCDSSHRSSNSFKISHVFTISDPRPMGQAYPNTSLVVGSQSPSTRQCALGVRSNVHSSVNRAHIVYCTYWAYIYTYTYIY